MSQQKQNLYEGMFIISSALSDIQRKQILDQITEGISSKGGEIHKIHEMGRKRLAYEIKGHRDGYYFVLYFSIDPTVIAQLWDEYKLNQGLLRYLTLRTEKVLEKIEFKPLVDA